MTEQFTKVTDRLRDELKAGIINPWEYLLLCFLLQGADKTTGIVIANARTIASDTGLKWERVRSTLRTLKEKGRLLDPDEYRDTQEERRRHAGSPHEKTQEKTQELRKKRGSTNPYPILLPDALTISEFPNPTQEETHEKTQESRMNYAGRAQEESDSTSPKPASELTKAENGKNLALRSDQDVDLDQEQQPIVPGNVHTTGARAGVARKLPLLDQEVAVYDFLKKSLYNELVKRFLPTRIKEVAEAVEKKNGNVRSKTGLLIDALEKGYTPSLTRAEAERTQKIEGLSNSLAEKEAELDLVRSLEPTPENFPKLHAVGIPMKPQEIKADRIQFLTEQIDAMTSGLQKLQERES